MSVPWLATAAAIMASWNGVTLSLYWPIAVKASNAGASSDLGTTLGGTGSGTLSWELKPQRLADLWSVAPPSLIPSAPKAVLHDSQKAWMICGWPSAQGPLSSL